MYPCVFICLGLTDDSHLDICCILIVQFNVIKPYDAIHPQ